MSKLFISGGTVIDPETLTRFSADVLCEDGRIAAIYKEPANAPKDAQVLDASGCFVCPGFVDPHGHIDGCKHTGMLSLLQGITTTVGGNCGFSPLDTGAFLRSQTEFPIHQAELVGLCALREAAGVTDLFVPARRAQVHTMETLCERALQGGAAGVSLGPGYAPGSSLEEMEALCAMARKYGRPAAIDTRIKATVTSTMYDMTRVTANGYFDADDNPDARYALRQALNAQRTADYKAGTYQRAGGVVDPLPDDAPFFVKDYHDYYKTPRGYHPRSLNSTDGWNTTSSLSLLNTKLLAYADEIRSAVLMIHGDKAHSCYFSRDAFARLQGDNKELLLIPGAVHTDLYDRMDIIPFDRIEAFYHQYLK